MANEYTYPKNEVYGKLILECRGSDISKCHMSYIYNITQVYDNLSVNLTPIGIPTYTAENAFCYDTGVQDLYTFSFVRINPSKIDDTQTSDQTKWSNKMFKENLSKLINRWQMETDGCKMLYVPPIGADRPSIPYAASDLISAAEGDDVTFLQYTTDGQVSGTEGMLNAYIQTITFEYEAGAPDTLSGTVVLMIGTMRGKRTTGGLS